ncbi:hypothetical protein KO504_05380 [Winogradskyella psychrotolerans]|uniref:hypothetical protein n=1 Tax=Winogradskyella psychrotolerans TaxID=1344585 RepID=UPI001C078140|nr:hypothetical protein [Winogradskyella psychrotolerans]MBU2920763.1 hypothetical protein [Winogradskyella psychrotolerans]
MKFIPTTKDSIALTAVTILTLSMFVSGLLNVLDYLIVKTVLLIGFVLLFIFALGYALKNETKKNHPEDKPQDDSY